MNFKSIIKKIFKKFNYRLVNLSAQDSNLENFTNYGTFKKIIKHFKDDKIIIFDIGTNKGQLLEIFLKLLKDMSLNNFEVHCFEPNPETFKQLKKFQDPKVIINNIAVGKIEGKKDFYCYGDPKLDSFYQIDKDKLKKPTDSEKLKNKIQVDVTTISSYCKKNNIEKINLLKIDTEGAEPECLEGAENMIKADKIDCLYSELLIGKMYKEIEQDISMLEKKLFDKFQLVGIGLNRDFYSEEKFFSIIHSLDTGNYFFGQTFLYLSKKIINKFIV